MRYIELEGVHPSWNDFFTPNILAMLEEIDSGMEGDCNPAPQAVLRFAQQPLEGVEVLILGQDTYPAAGVATGRAFEVGGLTSWNSPFRQVSLKNIVRRLYGDYTGESPYTPMSQVKQAMGTGQFPILPPDALFQSWAEQGVLLLNTALSCQVGIPASHAHLWAPFTQALLAFVAQARPHIHVFLWGSYARGFEGSFPTQTIHGSRHPMMCSQKYEDDFLKFDGFHATRQLISWLG